jgi:hypothetical protein
MISYMRKKFKNNLFKYWKNNNIYYYYNMVLKSEPPKLGSKTPTSSLGRFGRTGPAMLIGSSRSGYGSMNRIYSFANNNGQGYQFIQYLIRSIGPRPKGNPWNGM